MASLWKSISNIGANQGDTSRELRKIHLINRICFLGCVATFFFAGHMYFIGAHYYIPFQIATGILTGSALLFSKMRYFFFAASMCMIALLCNVFYAGIELPGCAPEYFMIPLGLIPFTIFGNKKVCLFLMFVAGSAFVVNTYLQRTYVPHELLSETATTLTFYIVLASVFCLSGIIVYQFRLVNDHYETIIEKHVQEVEEKNKEITDSIRYAKRIQTSIMPSEKFLQKTFERLRK